MILSLITNSEYIPLRLPDRKDGFFTLRDTDGRALFTVEGDGRWIVRETELGRLPKGMPAELTGGVMLVVRIRRDMQPAYLFAEDAGSRYAKYARCLVPDNVDYTVGSARDNYLVCLSPYVSPRHCRLVCRGRTWSVSDLGSQTGTYVNGRRVGAGSWLLSPGDVVSVLNQKFIVMPGLLAFNAQNLDTQALKGSVHLVKAPPLPLESPLAPEKPAVYFHRQTRFTDSVTGKDFSIAAPPAPTHKGDEAPAILSYGPGMVSGAAMLLAGMNPITGIGMLASSILFPKLNRERMERLRQEQEAKRKQLYSEYLEKLERELSALHDKQTELLRQQTPEPRGEAEKLLRDKSMLWSRRPEHQDFLRLRMGLGDIPVLANITFPSEGFDMADDPMRKKLKEFQEKPRQLQNVPIILDLGRFYSVGVSGSANSRVSFAAQLVGQLIMHIGYDDMKLCLIGPRPGPLASLRWLPHTWDNERVLHLTAGGREELDQLLPALDGLLENHRSDRPGGAARAAEELVILITDPGLAQSGVLTRLLFDRSYDAVHVITLAEHSTQLPSRTDLAVGVKESDGRMVWQEQSQRQVAAFRLDREIGSLLPGLARLMANTTLDLPARSAAMPDVVPFLDLFGVQDVKQLNILDRWERADPSRTLRVPIGVAEDGKPCMLDLSERADGPHGLIAGTTGSGKSELIMSYILSMAVSYSPEDVNFLLIDYKGGGMAQAFRDLPHTVGVITNLGSEISRSLLSIKSEKERRQRVFSEAQSRLGLTTLNIEEYQRLYRQKKIREPMPRLIIITDEFAELKSQEPDFMRELISLAHIGRSLGVHVILATQRPSGIVDDQITSNINFRLCLRVQDTRDSQDMLKCPDAAGLTRAGQFYKQVGYAMIKAQSAWTGAKYVPSRAALPSCGVEVLDSTGAVLSEQTLSDRKSGGAGTQAGAVTAYIAELAKRERIRVRPLWQPALEERIPLSDLRGRYPVDADPWALEPVLGELDDPANQRRMLVRADLGAGKNTIVYGGIGSGKVMLLSAVLEDLMLTHTPEQLHIYILDYFDDGLSAYAPAPHVGDVLQSDDGEKLARLLDFLEKEVSLRKRKLGGALAGASLSERLRAAGICRILVVPHNLGGLKERLGDDLGRLVALLKDGPRWGISFLATQESTSGLTSALAERFARRYVLRMDQDDAYSAVLGSTGKMRPTPVRGRGLLRTDDGLYEFQAASPDMEVPELCARLLAGWSGPRAQPIPVMPEHVAREHLAGALDPARPLRLPVGLEAEELEPAVYDLGRRVVNIVMGRSAGTIGFLRGFLPLAAENGLEVIALDQEGDLTGLPGVAAFSGQALTEQIERLFAMCKEAKAALDHGEPLPERRRLLIVLPAFRGLLDLLDGGSQESLRAMLEKARPQWRWTFLVCGSPQDFMAMQHRPEEKAWFSGSVSKTDMLYLGGGIRNQTIQPTISGDPGLLGQAISFPLGYTVCDTEAIRVRFIEEA